METDLPGDCNYFSVCGSRIREMKAIETQLDNCEHGLRAFQKLPRNMQRRAVSGNPQRLPCALREKHKREIGDKVKVNRRPCRKYRRRPLNLLKEYNRRQKDYVWLESHIWHAKRFHMVKKWGYHLPKTPTNKSYRATLRAATETCLVQDISYECCLEIQGPLEQICGPLSTIMQPNEVENLLDPEATHGRKWIQCTLYKPNMFPYGSMGDVQIIWSSYSWNEPLNKLWIWVHPAIYSDVLATVIDVFKYKKLENSGRIPSYISECTKLLDLKDTFVKFRLIGPRSYTVLQNVFVPSEVGSIPEPLEEADNDKRMVPWWVQFYSDPHHVKANQSHIRMWQSLNSNSPSSRRMLSLIVRDVRVVLPSKKLSFQETIGDQTKDILSEEGNVSDVHPIFDLLIRESVTNTTKTTHEINNCRSNAMVPGCQLPLTQDESRVPILLLKYPWSRILGGSGWEVILPGGWATQTLVAFIMNGGVVGGQAEEEILEREFLSHPPPPHLPDTSAGKLYMKFQRLEKEKQFFKRPPNCRINYMKLNTQFPFEINWLMLMKSWNRECEDLYVMRSKSYLNWLSSKSSKKGVKTASNFLNKNDSAKNIEDQELVISSSEKFSEKTPCKMDLRDALIYVQVVLIGKGVLEPFAIVCLPTEADLQSISIPNSSCCIIEPLHEDKNSQKRSELKLEYKKDLTIMRKMRKKAKTSVLCSKEDPLKSHSCMQEAIEAAINAVNEENQEMIKKLEIHDSKMQRLWLPNPDIESLQMCSRKIFGFLTFGGFCLRLGRSGGVGYVVAEPLIQYMKELNLFDDSHSKENVSEKPRNQKQIFVLLRNPSSLQYHWARLIVLNI